MINFKTISSLGGALVALGCTSAALAQDPSIYLEVGSTYGSNQLNPYQDGDGGEFTVLAPSLGVPAGYSSLATFTIPAGGYDAGTTGFETFCVEDQTYFYVNTTYQYLESENILIPAGGAVEGNNGVPDTPAPLTAGAAWLYSQFATGQLGTAADGSLYDYTDAATRLTDAGELQQAIWELEGAPADPTDPLTLVDGVSSNPFVNLVLNQLGGVTNAQASVIATGNNYGVQVLDLVTTDADNNVTGVFQDQLIYTGGVADNGTTLGLFGLALMVLAFWARRKTAAA